MIIDPDLTEKDVNGYIDNLLCMLKGIPEVVSMVEPFPYFPDVEQGVYRLKNPVVRGLSSVRRCHKASFTVDSKEGYLMLFVNFSFHELLCTSSYAYRSFIFIDGDIEVWVDRLEVSLVVLLPKEGIPSVQSFHVVDLSQIIVKDITGVSLALNWLLKIIVESMLNWNHEALKSIIEVKLRVFIEQFLVQGAAHLLPHIDPLYLPNVTKKTYQVNNAVMRGLSGITLNGKTNVQFDPVTRTTMLTFNLAGKNVLCSGHYSVKAVLHLKGSFKIVIGRLAVSITLRLPLNRPPRIEHFKITKFSDIKVKHCGDIIGTSNIVIDIIATSVGNSLKKLIRMSLQENGRLFMNRPLNQWTNSLIASLHQARIKASMLHEEPEPIVNTTGDTEQTSE